MAKITSNDLKFGNLVYLNAFHWFPKFWKISSKIGRFLARKRYFFADIGKISKNFEKIISPEKYQVHGKCSNWPKIGQKCTLGYFLQLYAGIFLYFAFFQIYGSRNAPRQQFWLKFLKVENYRNIAIFWPKMLQMT